MKDRVIYYILNDQKEPVPATVFQWADFIEEPGNRLIAFNQVGKISISTVFLGIDLGLGLWGPPRLFETMVFGGPFDEYQERYETYREALAGHQKALEAVQVFNLNSVN